jgi:inhibitor of cysteine peptidase
MSQITKVYFDTRKLMSFIVLALIAGGSLGGILWNIAGVYVSDISSDKRFGSMKQFTSLDELKDFLMTKASNYFINGLGFPVPAPLSRSVDSLSVQGAKSSNNNEFSSTNTQVSGVDEADVVKTDGEYIYMVQGKTILIIEAYPPEEASVISRIEIGNEVQYIYIINGKLIVFSDILPEQKILPFPQEQKDRTCVTIYDISDIKNPSIIKNLIIDGCYLDSRMIGDYLYFIIVNPAVLTNNEVVLPVIRQNEKWHQIAADEIWYPNITQGYLTYNTVTSINIMDPSAQINSETFLLNQGSVIYVSPNNLYIVSQGWRQDTSITKIGIINGQITYKGNATVPGYIINQFSMDEYSGVFRVATTSYDWRSGEEGNNVYTLSEDMKIIGSLEGLAQGEKIYSARFIETRCYLVTFKKVDPLFTIDLGDPYNPEVLGQLKIPGFSDYLNPYDDKTLIGIGKEAIEADVGDFAWYQGLKISLFDVSDVNNPREVAQITIGDRGTDSLALYDHHAFLFNREKNLLVIPILEANIDENDYGGKIPPNLSGQYTYQGAYIFNISKQGIELRGRVTHINDNSLLKSGYLYNSDLEIVRCLYIGNYLYTISHNKLKVNDLITLKDLAAVDLGE